MNLIIGARGSMGQRYSAILKYLNVPFTGVDKQHTDYEILDMAEKASSVILCTPTDSHFYFLKSFAEMGLKAPVLCEKPVTKNLEELLSIKDKNLNLTVMMQYKVLDSPSSQGESYYNYFRHGNDGLGWDCFQIIALARGKVTLKEDSPIWKCELNGKILSLADMDSAYVTYVQQWLNKPGQNIDEIIGYHEKVQRWLSTTT